jgi:hypothetical protein
MKYRYRSCFVHCKGCCIDIDIVWADELPVHKRIIIRIITRKVQSGRLEVGRTVYFKNRTKTWRERE